MSEEKIKALEAIFREKNEEGELDLSNELEDKLNGITSRLYSFDEKVYEASDSFAFKPDNSKEAGVGYAAHEENVSSIQDQNGDALDLFQLKKSICQVIGSLESLSHKVQSIEEEIEDLSYNTNHLLSYLETFES